MQRDQWDEMFHVEQCRLIAERGYSERRAKFRARQLMHLRHGRRPRRIEEVYMNGKASPIPIIWLAVIWGLLAGLGATELCLEDGAISAKEGVAIAYAFLVGAVAKYSNPEKLISPKPTLK